MLTKAALIKNTVNVKEIMTYEKYSEISQFKITVNYS